MNIKEIQFKTRKYWLWINLIGLIVFVFVSIFFGLSKQQAYVVLAVYAFLGFGLGVNPSMVLVKRDIVRILVFFAVLIYVALGLSEYFSSQSFASFFSIEAFVAWLALMGFLCVAGFIFGYLPVKILNWKDGKIKNSAIYDSNQAAFFIYHGLPDEIAQKTSLQELETILDKCYELSSIQNKQKSEMMDSILSEYAHFSNVELEKIFTIEKEYMKEIGIDISKIKD